jgi:hypothetical protein
LSRLAIVFSFIDRSEGFKEEQASMTASRIHLLSAEGTMTSTVAAADLPNYDDIPF